MARTFGTCDADLVRRQVPCCRFPCLLRTAARCLNVILHNFRLSACRTSDGPRARLKTVFLPRRCATDVRPRKAALRSDNRLTNWQRSTTLNGTCRINTKHSNLFRLYIQVRPRKSDATAKPLAKQGFCEGSILRFLCRGRVHFLDVHAKLAYKYI